MQKNSQDFSMQKAMDLAKSPAGQQLISMLQRTDSGQLKQAMDLAATGDYSQAKDTLSELLSSPEAQKLLRQLGG